jgi:hypothetical protein
MLHHSITPVIITIVALQIKETKMSDFGDIFDMFSRDDDSDKKKQSQQQNTQSQAKSDETDIKSLIINKLIKNKFLFATVSFVCLLIIGAIAYFIFNYVNDHGAKGIIDTVKPFIN